MLLFVVGVVCLCLQCVVLLFQGVEQQQDCRMSGEPQVNGPSSGGKYIDRIGMYRNPVCSLYPCLNPSPLSPFLLKLSG